MIVVVALANAPGRGCVRTQKSAFHQDYFPLPPLVRQSAIGGNAGDYTLALYLRLFPTLKKRFGVLLHPRPIPDIHRLLVRAPIGSLSRVNPRALGECACEYVTLPRGLREYWSAV